LYLEDKEGKRYPVKTRRIHKVAKARINNSDYKESDYVAADLGKKHVSSEKCSNGKLWSVSNDTEYRGIQRTSKKLEPGVYTFHRDNYGTSLSRVESFNIHDLIQIKDTVTDSIIQDIDMFWASKEKFESFGFPFRRGILMYGPPGSGKSCTIKIIINRVIEKGGVAIKFENPEVYMDCIRMVRSIQPDVPVVALMEDIDDIIDREGESMVLNVLDGVEGYENIVYLATTNYPENLEGRIKNRPSRFDRRYHVGYFNAEGRKQFIHYLCEKLESKDVDTNINIDKWVDDTKDWTPAHIQDLFISVHLFDHKYDDTVSLINDMRTSKISSDGDKAVQVGFGR